MSLSRAVGIGAAVLCLGAGSASPPASAPSMPAFPGAEGFGASSVGGRGGRVLEVTSLADDGPGSLRQAVEAKGARTIVFRVGGTIRLNSSIRISSPYVTIAGQTAPGGGITLANGPKGSRTPLIIETHDVVVRYIRSRPGGNPAETGTLDAITIASKRGDMYRVIVDHGSFTWATDEVCNIWYAAHDVTVQWSILAEGLGCSTHVENDEEQCHSMGMLIGSDGARDISIHHNLFAHNRHRNPKIRTPGLVDVVNNVVYNSGFGPGWRAPTYVHGGRGPSPVNFVGNYFKPGADTGTADWFIATKLPVKVYVEGNVAPKAVVRPDSRPNLVDHRHPAADVSTSSAEAAYEAVLAEAGASRAVACDGSWYTRRDRVDERVVNDVRQGTGRIIDDPAQVGGWPELSAGEPCPDADHDGLPDAYERLYGLDPADASDGRKDGDEDGYTNLEEYLNGTHPWR